VQEKALLFFTLNRYPVWGSSRLHAKLYGLSDDELRYILDPADVYGPDFPVETFRVQKGEGNQEIREVPDDKECAGSALEPLELDQFFVGEKMHEPAAFMSSSQETPPAVFMHSRSSGTYPNHVISHIERHVVICHDKPVKCGFKGFLNFAAIVKRPVHHCTEMHQGKLFCTGFFGDPDRIFGI